MALFFQLLTEEELRTLTVEQLATLRAAFYHELYTNQAIRRELSGDCSHHHYSPRRAGTGATDRRR